MNSNVQQACSTTSVDDRHPIATIKNVPTPASITQQGSSVTISAPRPVFLMRPTTSTSVVQGSPATTLSAKTNPRSAVKTTSGQPAVPLNRYKVSGQQSTVHHRPSSTIVSGQPSVQPNRYMPSGIQSVVDHCPSSTIVSDQPAIALNQYMASGQRRAVVHRPSSTIVSGQQAVESLTTPPRAPTKVVQQQSTKAVESGQSNQSNELEEQNPDVLRELLAKANEQIELLKAANRTLVLEKERDGKALRQYLYKVEKKLKQSEARSYEDIVPILRDAFKDVLTPNQIDVILKRKKHPRWTAEEKRLAFTVRFLSKRCYTFIRDQMGIPLPGLSTLAAYASHLDLRHGPLEDVLRSMRLSAENMSPTERVCVVSFDEMSVRRYLEYDQKADEMIGPHNKVQVMMVRGLFSSWKQTIFIAFDTKVTVQILNDMIVRLHEASYDVVAVVSDNGPENVGLRTQLRVDETNVSIKHPVTGERIYFFGDAPHQIKLIRNWLVEKGFKYNGKLITTNLLYQLIEEREKCELTPLFAFDTTHLELSSTEKQNVRKAVKLLSHTTATALHRRFDQTDDHDDAQALASMIEIVDDWFDVFNSRSPCAKVPKKRTFCGTNEQFKALNAMKELMKNMRVLKQDGQVSTSLVCFQTSIIMSINALQGLFADMQRRYGVKFIATYKLNQDLLENLFGQVRCRGGLNDRPTPMNVVQRIRLIILGKTPNVALARNTNTEVDGTDEFLPSQPLPPAKSAAVEQPLDDDVELMAQILQRAGIEPIIEEPTDHDMNFSSDDTDSAMTEALPKQQERDGFIYILGWVAFKLKKSHPHLGAPTYKLDISRLPIFLANLSYGGLTTPSDEFKKIGLVMEKAFLSWHGPKEFKNKLNIVASLVDRIMLDNPGYDRVVVQRYIKIRTIARMRYQNLIILGKIAPDSVDACRKRKNDSNTSRKWKKMLSR